MEVDHTTRAVLNAACIRSPAVSAVPRLTYIYIYIYIYIGLRVDNCLTNTRLIVLACVCFRVWFWHVRVKGFRFMG
jgi:hypothetical protein